MGRGLAPCEPRIAGEVFLDGELMRRLLLVLQYLCAGISNGSCGNEEGLRTPM